MTSQLSSDSFEHIKDRLKQQITELGVRHRLVTQFTSFIAVDESRAFGSGKPLRVLQPVAMPEDVSHKGVFGEQGSSEAVSIEAWGLTLVSDQAGKIRVAKVDPQKVAARSGIKVSWTLQGINRVRVHGLHHLEGLLLQASGPNVEVGWEQGRNVMLP